MKRFIFLPAVAVLSVLSLSGCDVDVRDRGELPTVHVDPGRAPDVDVRGPDVEVKTRETEATVPDIDVDTKKVKVKVPDVDVNIPREQDNEP